MTGSAGASGITGSAGTAGDAGTIGAAGTAGAAGMGGSAGTTGTAGTTGAAGTGASAGTTGTAGTSGSAGMNGGSGTTGTGGASGTVGRGGASGIAGTAGTGGSSGGTTGAGGGGGTCRTSLSGTVTDPAGRLPLFNAIVYVPTAAIAPIPDGVACDQCGGLPSGQPVAMTLTGSDGRFRLDGVPSGANVPLVMQLGKWRRRVTIPTVTACADNPIADPDLTRLPRNQNEGDLPRIALVTGHSDGLDCFLRRIGISDSEFTSDAGTGRVHMYVGGAGDPQYQGATQNTSGELFADAYQALFSDPLKLARYDMMVLACEGSQLEAAKLPYIANIKRYADVGGRILAGHLWFVWMRRGPAPWPATAQWTGGGGDLGNVDAIVDGSFPKGAAFSDWLLRVGASQASGRITLSMAQHSVDAVAPPTQRWIYTTTPAASTQFLTFNTPLEVPPANQCGRVHFTDVHAGSAAGSSHPENPFPLGCSMTTTPSAEEKALEFMLFDASSCVQSDTAPLRQPGSGAGAGSDAGALVGRGALLVLGDPAALTSGETALKVDLESRGMVVTLAPASGPPSLASGQNVIIASSSVAAATFAPVFKDLAVPMLIFGSSLDAPLGLVPAGSGNVGGVGGNSDIAIIGVGTPLVVDLLPGTIFRAHPTRSSSVSWALPGGSPIAVASVSGIPNQGVIFAFEKGAAMATGNAAARRVAIGWRTDAEPSLTVEAYKLFIAALKWTATAPP